MAWMIVSDSSCDIRELTPLAPGVQFALVPFKIRIGQREYVDLPTLNVPQMMQAMTDYNGASTSACPSPEEWAACFLQADQILAITISSNLSGSYNAAVAARQMVLEEHPDQTDLYPGYSELFRRTGRGQPPLANQKIAAGAGFEEVCDAVIAYAEAGHILFSLASFENLAKNGRVSKVVGFIAGALNMRVLGRRTPDGKIDFFFKTRGESRVLARILEQMDRDGFDGSRSVMVSHCHNEKAAQLLCHGIQAKWPDTTVEIVPCSGLCKLLCAGPGADRDLLRWKLPQVQVWRASPYIKRAVEQYPDGTRILVDYYAKDL